MIIGELLETSSLQGLAKADSIAFKIEADEDGDNVMTESVGSKLSSVSASITDIDGRLDTIQQSLEDAVVNEEVTPEAVVALALKVTSLDNKLSDMFVLITQAEYDALETKQEGVLYLIKQETQS